MTDPFTLTVTDTEDGMLYAAVHQNAPDWADQTGWFDPNKITTPVTVIGCGGIGSNVAFELITMGFKRFVLYDDDIVEPRNLASQKAFRHRDLYRPKVEALAEVLIEYGAVEVLVRQRLFTDMVLYSFRIPTGNFRADAQHQQKMLDDLMALTALLRQLFPFRRQEYTAPGDQFN